MSTPQASTASVSKVNGYELKGWGPIPGRSKDFSVCNHSDQL